MLDGVHILLTYACTYECDHCFVYSSPEAEGTLSVAGVREVLTQARDVGGVRWIYFEGGEPFLFYPTLLEGTRLARAMGFEVGIVTNGYWATSIDDAVLALRPLAELGVADLSVSDDELHGGDGGNSGPPKVMEAARRLGIEASAICIDAPFLGAGPGEGQAKGAAVVGGGALLKGRAADRLTEGLPRRPFAQLDSCPHEELESPSRVHVDPYGHVHLCQGISMGNLFERPLPELIAEYDAGAHPICGPLVEGGPARLAERSRVSHEQHYVDECHFCFDLRRRLLSDYPGILAPPQVYGPTKPSCEGA